MRIDYKLIEKLVNEEYDPAVEFLAEDIMNLIQIVKSSGEQLEGNILFDNNEKEFSGYAKNFLKKRRALALFASAQNEILEIGFNAGFSTLLMLKANSDLKITCVDICEHRYTKDCFNYIKDKFKERVNLIEGNSLTVLPSLGRQIKYSGYHIDGGHGLSVAATDLLNIIDRAELGSVICFDDTDFKNIKLLLLKYVFSGRLIDIGSSFNWINNNTHMFFKVV